MQRHFVWLGRRAVVGFWAISLVGTACGSSTKSPSGSGSPTTVTSSVGASGNKASAPGVTPTTIKIAMITSLSGSDSSNSVNIPKGFRARIDAQNAQGGVKGRQIKGVTEDDASSPSTGMTAAGAAVNAGVFAIDYDSPFAFGAARYLTTQNIPVVGGG
jgi:branched-chain amino acid transport system substrate-binding protein